MTLCNCCRDITRHLQGLKLSDGRQTTCQPSRGQRRKSYPKESHYIQVYYCISTLYMLNEISFFKQWYKLTNNCSEVFVFIGIFHYMYRWSYWFSPNLFLEHQSDWFWQLSGHSNITAYFTNVCFHLFIYKSNYKRCVVITYIHILIWINVLQ